MKRKLMTIPGQSLAVLITAGMVLPLLTPLASSANPTMPAKMVTLPEIFPVDPKPKTNGTENSTDSSSANNGGANSGGNLGKPRASAAPTSSSAKMRPARLSEEFSCPLFDNRPHAELIAAIDTLTTEVRVSQECTDNPSVSSLVQNTESLKAAVNSLKGMVATDDINSVDINEVDAKVTSAIQATQTLGSIINNNSFLNSMCGRQTMKSGKALLAFNDILNGLSPYALMAVSMNAALAPALPYVVGGIVLTSGISAMGKMIDKNTLDMSVPDHRTAVLVNTCQFVKVAKRVRYMQLAQSGRIDRITAELEKNVQLYNAQFAKPSAELNQLLALKNSVETTLAANEIQAAKDTSDLRELLNQVGSNSDDMMMCMLGNEMIQMADSANEFPQSIYTNLEQTAKNTNGNRLQVASLKSLNATSMRKIQISISEVDNNRNAITQCAETVRSWIAGHKQAVSLTNAMIKNQKSSMEAQLAQNAEYRVWSSQFRRLQIEKQTVTRVQKAMTELAKDTSIIDRSELDQRMSLLKAGLFGRRSTMSFGKAPVQAWLDHTKSMHDRSISAFLNGSEILQNTASNIAFQKELDAWTEQVKGSRLPYIDRGMIEQMRRKANEKAKTLEPLDLNNLPLGSRANELICGQLETAWLDWSAAMDHLGATQFFCDMIDPVLDVKVDKDIVTYCRGHETVNTKFEAKSAVSQAQDLLVRKGYKDQASYISKKMKELNCPMPPVSVMNDAE